MPLHHLLHHKPSPSSQPWEDWIVLQLLFSAHILLNSKPFLKLNCVKNRYIWCDILMSFPYTDILIIHWFYIFSFNKNGKTINTHFLLFIYIDKVQSINTSLVSVLLTDFLPKRPHIMIFCPLVQFSLVLSLLSFHLCLPYFVNIAHLILPNSMWGLLLFFQVCPSIRSFLKWYICTTSVLLDNLKSTG
jgi:hypothetical protein